MDPLKRLNKKQIKKHILIWFLIITYLNIYNPFPGPWSAKIIGGALDALNCIFVFYSMSLFIFPKFWETRRMYLLFTCIIICYCIFSAISYLNFLIIIPYFGGRLFYENHPISVLLIDSAFFYFIFSSAGVASFFFQFSTYKFTLHAKKEKSLLVKELNFLKNQFNSHITFNFLNYCYSKIHQKSPNIAESIELFSDILRYTLETKPEEKVPISKEIANIENFITLQRLLSTNVYATFSYKGETGGRFILSRILITLVENAFKHGFCNDSEYPILINLTVINNQLVLTVKNVVNPNEKQISSHTGLDNVKQMLELHYTNNYKLKIEEKDGFYTIELCMELRTSNESLIQPEQTQQRTYKDSAIGTKPPSKDLGLKPLMHLNKKQIQRHIITWALIIAYLYNITDTFDGPLSAKIIGSALIYISYIFVFYILSLFIFPKCWEGKRLFIVFGIIFSLLVYWTIYYLTCKTIIPALGGSAGFQNAPLYYFLKNTFYFFVLIGSAGAASFFSRYGLYKLKLQAEKEKTLLVKEINYLKDQFNSQLTFNFLNYCYNKVQQQLPETAKSIKLFSNMLRYTFQTKPNEKVALNNEVIYIEDFISLQKLLSAKVYVIFNYDGEIENKSIFPRILITFVENAFKHGLYNDPLYQIEIKLDANKDKLIFNVKNKINRNKKIKSTHTGLENVTQILELYYTNNYELKIEEKEDFFDVELSLCI